MKPTKNVVLHQVIMTVVLLLGLEGLARIGHTIHAELDATVPQEEAWAIHTPGLGWERRPNFKGPDLCGVPRTFDARGLLPFDAAQLKNKNSEQRTALFIGDFNTYGYCLPADSTFVEVADRALPQYRMINLGVPGYSSYQGYKTLLKYGSALKPDVIFVSFNFNDRRYVLNDEDVDGDRRFKKLARSQGNRFLEQIYLFRLAKLISAKLGLLPNEASAKTRRVRLDRLRPRVDEQAYKANLIRMVRWAREHRSAVFFILLGDPPNQTALLQDGITNLREAKYGAAIKDFKFLSQRPHGIAQLGQLYLSKAYAKAGQSEQAEKALWAKPLVSIEGGHPIRLDTEYNHAMRDVAEQYGVPLIDAKSALEKTPRVYFDICHFDAEGHAIVGNLIANVLTNTKSLATQMSGVDP